MGTVAATRPKHARGAGLPNALALLLVAGSVLVHWPPPQVDFTYDDKDFIENNASVRSPADALAAALRPFPPEQPERGLYRPLTNLSYALDFALFGDAARGYHFVDLALYLAVVLLVLALARQLFAPADVHGTTAEPGPAGRTGLSALAATLLFATHPVHCDAVDSASGRSELLALLFVLASILLFLRAVARPARRGAPLAASAGCYALACLSKESGVVLPALLPVLLLAREGAPRGARAFARRAFDLALAHLSVAFLYLALRLTVIGAFGPAHPVLAGFDPLTRLYTIGAVFAEYLRLLFWPSVLQLDFYYQLAVGIPHEAGAASLVGLAAAAGLLGVFATSLVQALRGAPTAFASLRGRLLVGLGIFFAFLAPVSHVFDIGALMAERFLFAPSLGMTIVVVALLERAGRLWIARPSLRRHLGAGALALVVLVFAGRSHARALEWRNGIALWRAAMALTPDDYRVHSNIAAQWIARGELAEAEAALRRALELEPGEPAARTNLAVVLTERGQLDEAIALYREILAETPRNFTAWSNLGVVYSMRYEHPLAIAAVERALELNPNFEAARRTLASLREQVEGARRFVVEMRARAASSDDPALLERYARACAMTGDDACAQRYRERARRLR